MSFLTSLSSKELDLAIICSSVSSTPLTLDLETEEVSEIASSSQTTTIQTLGSEPWSRFRFSSWSTSSCSISSLVWSSMVSPSSETLKPRSVSLCRSVPNLSEDYIQNNCRICRSDRRELENSNNDFQTHINEHHNVIRYLEYFLFLKTKSKGSYNGIEYFVNRCIELKNLNFLPRNSNTRFLLKEDNAENLHESQGKTEETLVNMVSALGLFLSNARTEKSQNLTTRCATLRSS